MGPEQGSEEESADGSVASDNSADLDMVKLFGARGGGMRQEDRDALAALAGEEQLTRHEEQVDVRVAFDCSMLMTRRTYNEGDTVSRRRWREISCDEPDDFEALRDRAWVLEDYRVGDLLELWPRPCAGPPSLSGDCVRSARVTMIYDREGARDRDPSLSIALNTRSRTRARQAHSGCKAKLALHVFEERRARRPTATVKAKPPKAKSSVKKKHEGGSREKFRRGS